MRLNVYVEHAMRIFKLFMLPLIGFLVFSFTGVAAQKTIKIAFMGSQSDEAVSYTHLTLPTIHLV